MPSVGECVPGRAPATDGPVGEAVSKVLRGPFCREERRGWTWASPTPGGQYGCRQRCSGRRLPPENSRTPTRWADSPPRSAREPGGQSARTPGWAPGWPCRWGTAIARPCAGFVLGALPGGEFEPTAGRWRPGTLTGLRPPPHPLCSGGPRPPPVPPAWPLLFDLLRTRLPAPSGPLTGPRLGELTSAQPPARPTSTRPREAGSFW